MSDNNTASSPASNAPVLTTDPAADELKAYVRRHTDLLRHDFFDAKSYDLFYWRDVERPDGVTKRGDRIVTVAFRCDPDRSVITYGAMMWRADCDGDRWARKQGRQTAVGRLLTCPVVLSVDGRSSSLFVRTNNADRRVFLRMQVTKHGVKGARPKRVGQAQAKLAHEIALELASAGSTTTPSTADSAAGSPSGQ